MTKLWKKSKQALDPAIEKYTVGQDHIFDAMLMPFDIQASKAHAKGLRGIKILTRKELKKILQTLELLEKEFEAKKVKITPADEDCHTVIENYLVHKLGDVGKKIHTGRSRNDQVLVALRLYMKNNLALISQKCVMLASLFLGFAEKNRDIPMPGYSHTQQAMLSSVGHYMTSFVESLLDDADFLLLVAKYIDKNPLGSAAGFGVSIPLDRMFTTRELGFGNVQINSLYCQNSRGKFESLFLESLAQVMLTLGRFANDLLLFTSREFDFFVTSESLVTGSSIMPHKRNLDVMEILRGNASVVITNQLAVKDISKNLLSGYNRDLQLMKKPLMESVEIVLSSLGVVEIVLAGMSPKVENMRAKLCKDIFAADIANKLVLEKDIPFRDAYKAAMGMLHQYLPNLEENIVSKKSLGAPGNLGIQYYRTRIQKSKGSSH